MFYSEKVGSKKHWGKSPVYKISLLDQGDPVTLSLKHEP
jgi:hypothetical protein